MWPPASSANFLGAINVEAFLPMETYARSLAGLAEEITSGPRRPGVDAIHLPGEGSASRKRRNAARGLMVSSEMWAEIASLAGAAGVTHPLLETWRTTA
jgi:LDH2 family malate/lactate/ureidoglycolate dehydrogenase